MIQKRKTAILFLLISLLSGAPVVAVNYQSEYEDEPAASIIEQVYNLQKQAARAKQKRVPLLIVFTTPWCSYCETLEKEIIEPMLKTGLYRDRLIIRKLEINDYSSVTDFYGQRVSVFDVAMRMKVDLYPTLVFFNGEHKEMGRLVGITVLEFVADDLDKLLKQAQRRL